MAATARIQRTARVPDALRVARGQRAPELGPRLLFLSGGSALRPLSRVLKQYTHNSVHLITVFDSGGSSAQLRRTFSMPAVGDLRNRIVALADESVRGNPEIYRLFCHRLSTSSSQAELSREFLEMVSGSHPLVSDIPEPMRQIVRTHLRFFAEQMPTTFDLRGANIGNLLLAGGYLTNSRDLDSVLFLFSKLLEVRGVVQPMVDVDLHLAADLDNGECVVGQHALSGRERPISHAVRDLRLIESLERVTPARAEIRENVRDQFAEADLICFPMGSFYSSVVANLLPSGVGRAIARASCPRVYVPNTGFDPEQLDHSLADTLEALASFVRRDAGEDTPMGRITNLVMLDENDEHYSMKVDRGRLEKLGVEVLRLQLVTDRTRPCLDPTLLTEALLSLV